jgi:hypothetical protein
MQRKFIIRGKEFLFRDLDPNDDTDFQFLDDMFRKTKKYNKLKDEDERIVKLEDIGKKCLVELSIEPKLTEITIEDGGLIIARLVTEVGEWLGDKIKGIIDIQKKN